MKNNREIYIEGLGLVTECFFCKTKVQILSRIEGQDSMCPMCLGNLDNPEKEVEKNEV